MIKIPLILLAVCALCSEAALAADSNSSEKPKASASKPAAATATKPKAAQPEAPVSEAKKTGMFGRVFGKKGASETPPATPAASPAKAAPATAAATKPKKADPEKPASEKAQTTAAEKKAALEKSADAPAAAGRGKKGAKTPVAIVKAPDNQPPETKDPEVLEKWKLSEAKAKALQDPELLEIKIKADAASSDEENRKTLKAYNKALFSKIREIDPSITERAKRMEVAILRQLDEME